MAKKYNINGLPCVGSTPTGGTNNNTITTNYKQLKIKAMKANEMNTVAREIRNNRNTITAIINEFRAYWCKLYRSEANEAYKTACANGDKGERYAIEQIFAKCKSLTIKPEIAEIIGGMHDADKVNFSSLSEEHVKTALAGLDYVNGAGELCEKKRIKGTDEYEWKPVEKWTEAKVGRYFRLAAIRLNEQSK